jgi:plastocyanin
MRLRKLCNMNRLARMRHAIHADRGSGRSRARNATGVACAALRRAEPFTVWASLWWIIPLTCSAVGQAGELSVSVRDRSGHAVANVVVTAMPAAAAERAASPDHTEAIMDQQNMAFVPQVLVVATGSDVKFPNSDMVSHQVYSFSAAKRFQLPLYKGAAHPPVNFDKPGLVVLGCNIHDQMVGYILVTDAPYFGRTDAQGTLHWSNLPPGTYTVTLWSPYIADAAANLTRSVSVSQAASTSTDVQLTRDLRTTPQPRPRRSDWAY